MYSYVNDTRFMLQCSKCMQSHDDSKSQCEFENTHDTTDDEKNNVDVILKDYIPVKDLRNIILNYYEIVVEHYTIHQTHYASMIATYEPFEELISHGIIFIKDIPTSQ